MSAKYSLNKADGVKILTALGYLLASTTVAFAIDLLPNLDIGANYAWLIPLLNMGLVTIKKFLEEK